MPISVNQAMINKIAGDDLWEQQNVSYSIDLEEDGAQEQSYSSSKNDHDAGAF
jgi:hypothetical protein